MNNGNPNIDPSGEPQTIQGLASGIASGCVIMISFVVLAAIFLGCLFLLMVL